MTTYLDHNASTPLDARVLNAMLPFLTGPYANPSSQHRYGRAARDAVETARAQVAALVQATPDQVILTSGGTEANNLAVKGVAARSVRGRLLYSAVEHPCVQEPMDALRRLGWNVATMKVNDQGVVDAEAFASQLGHGDVRLVSCMLANNETGVIQDVAKLASMATPAGAVFHTDAVQAAGKMAVSFPGLGVQLMSLSSHKIYGPKGAGALIAGDALELEPLLHGGGQEQGRRGGTENVAAIVGFGAAAELARDELELRAAHTSHLRNRLENALNGRHGLRIFGLGAPRIPNTCQFAVPGLHSATLLGLLDKEGFAVSSGSACATGSDEPSPVLLAMGVEPDVALCAVRVSLGQDNTEADVDGFVEALSKVLSGLGMATSGKRVGATS